MDEWVKAIITLAGGFVLGIIASFLFRRLSDGTGEGAEQFGQRIDEVVDGVTGAEERASESVGLVSDVEDTSRGVEQSVERLSDSTDRAEDAVSDARESVGRIRELIKRERETDKADES